MVADGTNQPGWDPQEPRRPSVRRRGGGALSSRLAGAGSVLLLAGLAALALSLIVRLARVLIVVGLVLIGLAMLKRWMRPRL